ncbi:SpdD-like protein [Streptomyces agglomeratus]|uniref:SpdD-like protein n=1 Tax=Streptomyces agglomeratus TaxID=285458 RepID=UPI0008543AFB|nr:SpdD-like protein [Streptomyces agglomeratus]OEJ52019.1 SpdD-like protein [Streptomyces agglomeratus]
MFRPRIPTMPTPTGIVAPLVHPATVDQHQHATACACQHTAPTPAVVPAPPPSSAPVVRLTPTGLLVAVGGGAAVVLVVGAVLVSLLLAVAITGASVAVCAVVLRSMVNNSRHR